MNTIILIILEMLVGSLCFAQEVRKDTGGPDSATHITKAAILHELDVFVSDIKRKHIRPFLHVKKSVFLDRIQAIKDSAAKYDADELMVQWLQVNALLQDNDTYIEYKLRDVFPYNFYWYDEGIYLTGGLEEDKKFFGSRLIAVNGIPVDSVAGRITSILAEKDRQYVKTQVPGWITEPYILHGLQISSTRQDVVYTLVGPGQDIIKVTPKAVNRYTTKFACECDTKNMLAYSQKGRHWFRYVDTGKYIYFMCGSDHDNRRYPFKEMEAAFMDAVNTKKPEKIIIDLRYDWGGNERLLKPLIADMTFLPQSKKKQLYVLIGKKTDYTGITNAVALRDKASATLVGEATSGNTNDFWDTDTFILPATKLTVHYSKGYGNTHPDALMPDVLISDTYADFNRGVDTPLEYVIKH